MTKPYFPNEPYLLMRWSDLETAWRMLAAPDKQAQIDETLNTVKTLSQRVGPEKAIFTMIAATAWLTDDGSKIPPIPDDTPVSRGGWPD